MTGVLYEGLSPGAKISPAASALLNLLRNSCIQSTVGCCHALGLFRGDAQLFFQTPWSTGFK